jgi:hypothetical protein
MSMTTADVLLELRKQIKDTTGTPRYNDLDLFTRLTRSQRKIADDHPEALCSDTAVVTARPTAISASVPPVVNDAYFMALVHFAAYLTFLEDSEDKGNAALAKTHYELYLKEVS